MPVGATGSRERIRREARKARFARVGMGLAPDYRIPVGGPTADPLSAAQLGQDITLVATLRHEDVQLDGVLWQVGDGTASMAFGFLETFYAQSTLRQVAGGSGHATIRTAEDTPAMAVSGIHTYVWTFELSNPDGLLHAYMWVDGRLIDSAVDADTKVLADLPSDDWYFGVEGPVAMSSPFNITGDLTGATIMGDLEVFSGKPAILG